MTFVRNFTGAATAVTSPMLVLWQAIVVPRIAHLLESLAVFLQLVGRLNHRGIVVVCLYRVSEPCTVEWVASSGAHHCTFRSCRLTYAIRGICSLSLVGSVASTLFGLQPLFGLI